MRRLLMNVLALIGGLTVVAALARAGLEFAVSSSHVIVTDRNSKPLANVPVFLDRGTMAIERYTTDSTGALKFPIQGEEVQHAVWLICAPGAIPMVGMRDVVQSGPTTYGYTPLQDSTWGWYRANGWRGPIPRECPRGVDSIGWRYPASSGKPRDAITFTEPKWPD
jgi:hypothetical protein